MKRIATWRWMKVALLLTTFSLAFGSVAWGYDSRQDEVRQRAYRNGYSDGARTGHFDRERGFRFRFKNDQWHDGRSGYEYWMGSFGRYKKAYRNGYEDGYRRGFESFGYRRDGRDRDYWQR